MIIIIIIKIIIIIMITALPRRHFHKVALRPLEGPTALRPLSKDDVVKEDHLDIQPYGQAGNRTRDLLASSQRSYQLS